MRFQNGSNKVVIELRVVEFWSEIILVISNFKIQTKLHCTQFNYGYKSPKRRIHTDKSRDISRKITEIV